MMRLEDILQHISEAYPESIIIPGFDEAIIGVSTDGNIIYDKQIIISILMDRDDMSFEDATSFYDYNIERSVPYMRDGVAPIIVELFQ